MLTLILAAAGYTDYKIRKIPNYIIALLLLYAFIFGASDPISKTIYFLIVFIPCIIIAVITDRLKGGDVKFVAALAPCVGIGALTEILFVTFFVSLIYGKCSKQKSVPLAAMVFISWIIINAVKLILLLCAFA